jgi:hypothetical protein
VEVLDDKTGRSGARFLARAVVWFARHIERREQRGRHGACNHRPWTILPADVAAELVRLGLNRLSALAPTRRLRAPNDDRQRHRPSQPSARQALGLHHLRTRPYAPKTTDVIDKPFLGRSAHGRLRGEEQGSR